MPSRSRSKARSPSPAATRSGRKPAKRTVAKHDKDSDGEDSSSSDGPKMLGNTRAAMTGSAVAKDESKKAKIIERVFWGVVMVVGFLGTLYAGHIWVCGLVFILEVLLFRELVKVSQD